MNVHKGMLTRLYQALATLATIHTCLYLQELRGLELRNSIWEPSAWQHQHSHPQPAPLKHQLIHWTLQMWCSWLSLLLGMLGQLPTSIRTKEWEIGQKDILRMSNRTLESLLHEQESTTELPTSFLCVKFVFEKSQNLPEVIIMYTIMIIKILTISIIWQFICLHGKDHLSVILYIWEKQTVIWTAIIFSFPILPSAKPNLNVFVKYKFIMLKMRTNFNICYNTLNSVKVILSVLYYIL